MGRSRKEPGAPAAQHQGWENSKVLYSVGPGARGTGRHCVPCRRGRSCSMLMLMLMLLPAAAPGGAPCTHAPAPCPMPRTGCSRRFLVVNRHRHTVPSPECAVYPSTYLGVHLHTAHTHWLRPHPRRSISHGTRPRLTGHLVATRL